MVCDTCRYDNQPNAKFCSECGAALARQCRECGRRQPLTAKFCDECGTSLTARPAAGPAPVPAAARKRVTALFADLVGSTAFAERLDPEAVRSGLAPYFELLQSTIDDHAGTVVKFLGDGMFALFGVPEVAEDDALRAVTAGVELQRRFRSFADEVRVRHGVELGLRVGVNTGELVVGVEDVELVGDVLNTASRLESACRAGCVLVGEDTWRLTRSSVSYEVLDEVRVKGKADAVATFQVVDEDAAVADDLTPFVGRTDELATMRAAFDDAVAASAGRLVTVIGEPGVGKTRLAHELHSTSGARSFDLRLERRGSTTFAPIADLLREVTGSGSADEIGRLVEGHPESVRLGAVLASFLGQGGPRTTEESFWAVRRLLELLAADGPVIVVVDDIQWAEPLFWDLLDHLAEWTTAPVLLLALARPELRELRPELTQPGRRVSATVALTGLDPGTTLELAARLLGIDELPGELAERLPRSTDGNPLFVRELVQMLVDDGVLAPDGDHWHLTIDADAIDVPPTIQSLLASRVERLSDDERQVVGLASVIGTEFDRGTLGAIATGDIGVRLGSIIDRLRRKELIELTGQWSGDHPVYRFHHVLIRDAAYRRLLKGHRSELHERVGRHVETTTMSDDERDVIVAHHFEQVHRYRSELGTVDDHTRALAGEAAGRLRSTAEQALGREDLASAGSAAIRALHLLPTGPTPARDELLVLGCEALLASADVARGAPLVDELHTRSADARLAAWADCFRAQLWSLTAAERLIEAGALAADAAERLTEIGDQAGVAKARLVRAGCLARLGRVGDCESELDLALGAARSAGDRRRTVAVLGAAPLAALWGPSPVARAGGRCLDVLRLLRITTASPTVEATSIRCQGMLEALRGREDAARAKFETSRSIAHELGLRHALYETELFAGLAELLHGDAVAAEPHLRAARDGLGRLGIGADAGQAAALLARSLLLQGQVDEADELATAALETAGQNLQTAISARAVLAEVRASQGDHGEAGRLVADALTIVAPTDVTLDHALTLLAAGRVAADAGNSAEATRHRAEAERLLASKGVTLHLDTTQLSAPAVVRPSPDTTGSGRSRPRIWNQAIELGRRATEAATARDRDGFMACFAADFTSRDHGDTAEAADFPGRVGAESWTDFAMRLMEQSEESFGEAVPIAKRGDDHGVIRWTLRGPTVGFERLVVLSVDGVALGSAHFFDPDQLADAIDVLDRQWVEHDPGAVPYATLAAGNRARAAVATGDPEAMRALVSADFVAVDHRQVGLGDRRLDDWIASNDMSATGHPFLAITTEILDGDDRHCLARLAASAGDDTWYTVSLLELRDGLISRMEHFDDDDIESATARYWELVRRDGRQRAFTNTAFEVSQLATQAFDRGDADGMRALLAPGFRAVWHDRLSPTPLESDRETFVDVLFELDGRGDARHHEVRLLAVRGADLALTWNRVYVNGAEQYVRFRVNESAGRQLIGVEWFDEDRLEEAVAELDRRWLATCGVPSDSVVVRAWPLTGSTRAGDIADFVHPQFEYTDHCRLRADQHAGDLAEFVRRGWVEPETWALVTNVHRFDESGAVYERVEYFDDDEIWLVWVAQEADGAMRRLDRFDHDDLDAAIALFDSRRATPDADDRRVLTNTAWEVSRRPGDAAGPAAAMDGAIELLAVRGDHLALTRNSTHHAGAVHLRYAVIESDDHDVLHIDWFDGGRLAEAHEELDRRWLIDEGFAPGDWFFDHWHLSRSTDPEALLELFHADVDYVGHRAIGSGGGDRSVLDALARETETIFAATVPRVFRISQRAAVFERVEYDPAGGGEICIVIVIGLLDDRVRHFETFDPDQFEAALARYDELTRAPASPKLANTSSRLTIAWTDEAARSPDRAARLLSPDFTIRAHGRWAEWFPELTGPELLAVLGSEEGRRVVDVVAVRGDHLSLLRRTRRLPSGLETDARLFLVASEHGLITSIDWYQDGQEGEAFAELDARFLAGEGFAADSPLTLAWPGLYGSGSTALAPYLHPDLEYVDHRPFIEHRGGVDFLLRNADASRRSLVTVPQVFRVTDRSAVLERVEVEPGEPGEVRTIVVLTFADDLARHLELFDPGALDAALERHAELTSTPAAPVGITPNRAYRIAEELARAAVRRDRDAMLALLADDFRSVARSALRVALGLSAPMTRVETVDDLLVSYSEGNVASQARAILATRGDRLYLSTSTLVSAGGDELVVAVVGESDDTRLKSLTSFDESQLAEAYDELDRRYRLACGIDDDHWVARRWDALTSFDADRYDEILSADFQAFDHRAATLGLTGRAEFLAWIRATPASSTWSVPTIHRLDDRAMVLEHAESWTDGAGESRMLVVIQFGDGLTTRMDAYDIDDLDTALARYDELTASRRALTNDAWESARRRQEMTSDGARSDMELIAIRGDDLCLYRVEMISPAGDMTERLIVDATRDGRCTRMDIFDPDQLADALATIDRRYRLACGIGDDHWITTHWHVMYSADFAEIRPVLHPEFESVERRPLAWPSGDTAAWREWMTPNNAPLEVTSPAMYRLCEHGVVYLRSERLEAGDLGVSEVILVNEVEAGSVRRVISYAPEDLDRALAEFDEFVAGRSARTLTNGAWEVAEGAQRVRLSGDRDRFATFFADDFVVTSHDSIMAQVTGGTYDKALRVEAAFDPLVFGPTSRQDLELIAVRGENHCLFRSLAFTRSGDLHERLNVLEVQDGRGVRMDVFPHDQLRAAQLELDRWYRRSCGLEDVRWMAEEGAVALYATDFTSIEPFLHPDFEYIEHRPLLFFVGDATDLQQAFDALPVESEVIVPVVHRLSEHGMVCERLDLYRNGRRSEQLHVSHFQDGRVRRLEGFAVADLDRAIAEFDAFIARREAGERLTNTAWALAQTAMLAHRDGDRDRFASCLTDDFVGTAHDPIMASVDVDGAAFDRARFVEASFDPLLYGPGSTGDVELIAVRGDDSCLFRIRTTSTAGDVNERIHGLEVRDGLGVRWDSYGGDQLRQAQIELDRRWLVANGFDDGDWVVQHWDLVYGIAFDEFDDILHDDFEFVDHRPLHFPSGDAAALSTTMSSLSHDVEVLVPQVHRFSARGGVFERIERAVGEVLGEEHMLVVSHITDGRLRRLEAYTVDDLASAVARYDELTGQQRAR